MYLLFTILISLLLGYSLGIRHERKKYICIEDPETQEEIIQSAEKIPVTKRVLQSVRRNLF